MPHFENAFGRVAIMVDDDVWEKAREQLVKQRQLVIEALARGYERGVTESNIDSLLKIQSAIDILDNVEDREDEDED
jgi:hypothetical protein